MAVPIAAKLAVKAANSKTGRRIAAGIAALVLLILLAPFLLMGSLMMMLQGGGAACGPADGVPGYTTKQLGYVQQFRLAATEIGVSDRGLKIAVMVGIVESHFKNYANSNVPESLKYGYDDIGSDHDSLGIIQQRGNWGPVKDRMTPKTTAITFFKGYVSPDGQKAPGLLDLKGWETMPLGDAAQRVQVSAYPDRYAAVEATADKLLAAASCSAPKPGGGGSGKIVGGKALPVPEGIEAGTYQGHHGVDFPAPRGTPIYAVADGVVSYAGREGYGARVIFIRHAGGTVTQYAHMHEGNSGVIVVTGQKVKAGQKIGEIGSSGLSTGDHLHFEVELGVPETTQQPFNSTTAPYRWLKQNGITPGPLHAGCGNCGGPIIPDDFAYSGAYTR